MNDAFKLPPLPEPDERTRKGLAFSGFAMEAYARAAIAAYLRKHGEPVAWRYKYADGFWRFSNGKRINGCNPIESQPLYTAPQPTPQERQDAALWDKRPHVTKPEHGPEPSLRMVLKSFYRLNGIPVDLCEQYTEDYIAAMSGEKP